MTATSYPGFEADEPTAIGRAIVTAENVAAVLAAIGTYDTATIDAAIDASTLGNIADTASGVEVDGDITLGDGSGLTFRSLNVGTVNDSGFYVRSDGSYAGIKVLGSYSCYIYNSGYVVAAPGLGLRTARPTSPYEAPQAYVLPEGTDGVVKITGADKTTPGTVQAGTIDNPGGYLYVGGDSTRNIIQHNVDGRETRIAWPSMQLRFAYQKLFPSIAAGYDLGTEAYPFGLVHANVNLSPITALALEATTASIDAGMWRDDSNRIRYPDGTDWRTVANLEDIPQNVVDTASGVSLVNSGSGTSLTYTTVSDLTVYQTHVHAGYGLWIRGSTRSTGFDGSTARLDMYAGGSVQTSLNNSGALTVQGLVDVPRVQNADGDLHLGHASGTPRVNTTGHLIVHSLYPADAFRECGRSSNVWQTVHTQEVTNGTTGVTTIGNATGGVSVPGSIETNHVHGCMMPASVNGRMWGWNRHNGGPAVYGGAFSNGGERIIDFKGSADISFRLRNRFGTDVYLMDMDSGDATMEGALSVGGALNLALITNAALLAITPNADAGMWREVETNKAVQPVAVGGSWEWQYLDGTTVV